MADQPRPAISGHELRLLADRAHAAGQKQLSIRCTSWRVSRK
jgi:hypothetical protein